MTSFETAVQDAATALESHPWGHLPLAHRVELLRILRDPAAINRVFLECARQVYPIWIADNGFDTAVHSMLEAADAQLDGRVTDAAVLTRIADDCRGEIEGSSHISAMAGMSAVYLCYSLANNAAGVLEGDDLDVIDDGQLDWDVWTPDFYASIAAANGNPFVGAGDPTRRRAFWQWYLTVVSQVHAGTQRQLLELPSANKAMVIGPPPRTQSWERSAVADNVFKTIELCIHDLEANVSSWDRMTLTGECMKAGLAMKGRYLVGAQECAFTLKYYLYKGDDSAVQLMNRVKSEMYEQARAEGAWMQFTLVVEADSPPAITFNYDDVDTLPPSWRDPSSLAEEFRAFPRAKTFTPPWWHDVVNKSGLSYRPCQQKE